MPDKPTSKKPQKLQVSIKTKKLQQKPTIQRQVLSSNLTTATTHKPLFQNFKKFMHKMFTESVERDNPAETTKATPHSPPSEWGLERYTAQIQDPLLSCLSIVAQQYRRTIIPQQVVKTLALKKGYLTPEIFPQAAKRVGFEAQIIQKNLEDLLPQDLPTILFLKDKKTCVLTQINPNHIAQIILPEQSTVTQEIPLDQLNSLYTQYLISLKPIHSVQEALKRKFFNRKARLQIQQDKTKTQSPQQATPETTTTTTPPKSEEPEALVTQQSHVAVEKPILQKSLKRWLKKALHKGLERLKENVLSTQREESPIYHEPQLKGPISAQTRKTSVTPDAQKQAHWTFQPELAAPYDPLIECLLIVAKLKNKPTSKQTLITGLPLINHRITPEIFPRAAQRAGLSAKVVKEKLKNISRRDLPAILFLNDGNACVLMDIHEDGFAVVLQPETGDGVIQMTLDDLIKIYADYAIFLQPMYHYRENESIQNHTPPKHWFWDVVCKAWPLYGEVLVAALLLNIFSIASPLFIMNVYDRVVPNKAVETLWVLTMGIIIVFAFDFILRNLRSYFIDAAGKRIDIQLSTQTFEQLMDLEMGVRPTSVGSLANTVYAFEAFKDFITSATVSVLIDIPFIILFIIVMAMIGGIIAWIPVIMIPLVLLISVFMQIPLNRIVQETYQYTSEKQTVLFESLAGIETVKGMRSESLMQSQWERMIRALAKLNIKLRTLSNLGLNLSIYAQHLTTIAVIIVGVYQISNNKMTIGALIACSILVGRVIAPIGQLAGLVGHYKQSKSSLEALNMIMRMPVEHSTHQHFLHREQIKGDLEFRHVSFAYPGQPISALKDMSFKIKAGEKVAIIGRTGSGKTTIEKLLMKFYLATSGTILVDGLEIQQLDPAELRYHIGYIPQDVVLFHGSIRDNIVIGAPYVDDATVLHVSGLSGVDTFVNQHPQGFDRTVVERGQNLSGGQRQAIAIARALLLNPPVLIFDEPCNAMDDTTIAHFLARFKSQMAQKTLILVTHRISLLQLVDRLIVIEGGQVVLDGPKEQVIQKLNEAKQHTNKKT